MDEELLEKLKEKVLEELDGLEDLQQGEEKHSAAVESISKLCNVILEQHKIDKDFEAKEMATQVEADSKGIDSDLKNRELDLRERELQEGRTFGFIDVATEVGGRLLDRGFENYLATRCFNFETTGTPTSTVTRNLLSKVFRFK